MDDQQTYLLNGLIARQFELGRISRFRKVGRGRQAETFELLTSEHHEFLVYLYPPAFTADQLNFAARAVNMLDRERFSVMPMLAVKGAAGAGAAPDAGVFAAEGPQGAGMLVSLAPAGSPLAVEQYTEHDISQLGLRLAWLHRLLGEQLAAPTGLPPLSLRLRQCLESAESRRHLPNIPRAMLDHLLSMLNLAPAAGWAHGDIQPAGLLMDADHQLRSVVDFGLLHYGSPLEDLVDAFLTLAVDSGGGAQLGRGKALLESYDSLLPIRKTPWSPVVAAWCGQRLLDAGNGRRVLPGGFPKILAAPENLATALASCIP